MRELEFLPGWYPMLRRRRRVLVLEAWMAIVSIAVLSLWLILSAHNVIAKESLLDYRTSQLKQSNYELQKLAELESLKRQMSDQAKLMAHLGPNVPMGRLMDTLEQTLPKGMALLNVSVEYKNSVKSVGTRPGTVLDTDPEYVVEVHGVSPSDAELGNFMINLAKKIPDWDGGELGTESDLHQNGHLMREFTFAFGIKLNDTENQG